jgi:TonB family protein
VRRAVAALVLSLLVNFLLLSHIDLSWVGAAAGPKRSVNMAPLAAREWEANRAVASAPLRPAPAMPSPPPMALPQPTPNGQVVMADRPREPPREPPKDARFLAEFDSKVEKETRSRHIGLGGAQAPQQKVESGPRGQAQARAEAAKAPPDPARLAFDWKPSPALERGLRGLREPTFTPAPQPGAAPRGFADGDGAEKRVDLRPSAAAYLAVNGGGTPDRINGVDEGEQTLLNTREWRYAGFFNRVGAEVYPHWVREMRTAAQDRDPTAQRFLYKDRETDVAVRLDSEGRLLDVRVVKSSGATFLDDAVVKAWREAQPFANVPKGLANDRNEIVIPMAFVVIGASSSGLQFRFGPSQY